MLRGQLANLPLPRSGEPTRRCKVDRHQLRLVDRVADCREQPDRHFIHAFDVGMNARRQSMCQHVVELADMRGRILSRCRFQ